MTKKFSHRLLDSRILLVVGFGSLLVLPLIAFATARSGLVRAAKQGEAIRQDYVKRTLLLSELRGDVIDCATHIRNYLMDPSAIASELHREHLIETKARMDKVLGAEELRKTGKLYQDFVIAYRQYWQTTEPILSWDAEKRKKLGFEFVRKENSDGRAMILGLTDKIGVWNDDQLAANSRETEHVFLDASEELQYKVAMFLLAGLALAIFVVWRVGALEAQASERFMIAEQTQEDLRDLSAKVVGAQEEERKRISRELHDEVAQNLSAIRVGLEKLVRVLPPDARAAAHEEFEELGFLTDSTLKSTRNISQLLRPSMLDDLGLVPALRWLAKECTRRNSAKVEVEAEEDLEGLGEETRICVYRVVQEALNNAMNHGKASEVKIRALRKDGKLLVSIQDNGRSFDVERDKGMGTIGMMERVEGLGGKLRIVSQNGIGTVVLAELP